MRAQTGEHILAKIIENQTGAKVIIATFEEDSGRVEFSSEKDLRELSVEELEKQVKEIIDKELPVNIYMLTREQATEFDLHKIPESVTEIRIVDIEGFDKRPCRDPHVQNTKEIGTFKIDKVKRSGNNRYKFLFHVE